MAHAMDSTMQYPAPPRALWLLGLVVPALPLLALAVVQLTGQGLWWWLGPAFFYGAVPVLDRLCGENRRNPVDDDALASPFFRRALYAYLPLQLLSTAAGAWSAVHGALDPLAWLGLAMTVGIANGGGINVAHELGHKRDRLARWMSKLALAPSLYGHFLIEHNRGHHRHVATPEDPASARFGESLWAFLPRTMLGGLRSAWRLERERLQARGRPVFGADNEILQGWLLSALLFGGLAAAFGAAALPLLLLQALSAAATLETVNYIEHYGLLRERDADGRYQRCTRQHSWNSSRRLSNLLLYQLERHSDHHADPLRPYQRLRHHDDSPQLPAGYAALIPLALLPPLWFRLMNPRVLAFYGGDASRTNRGRRAAQRDSHTV